MNHRPALLAALLLLALLCAGAGRAAEPAAATTLFLPLVVQPGASGLSAEEQAVLNFMNQERQTAGCPALAVSPALQAAARRQSQGMSTRDYFSHTDPDGNDAIRRARAAGYPSSFVGENIAIGWATPQLVMYSPDGGWMNSPGHRENILNCTYTETGVGYAFEPNDQFKLTVNGRLIGPFFHYWTQVFGNPSP